MLVRLALIALFLSMQSSCTTGPINWDPDDYTVVSGDTLYSIAWRYEIDPMDLASWNHLEEPYRIYPGDRLHTKESDSLRADQLRVEQKQQQAQAPSDEITVRPGDTLYSLAKSNGLSVARLAAINGLKWPYVINPGQTLRLNGEAAAVPVQVTASTSRPTQQSSGGLKASSAVGVTLDVDSSREVNWQWPVKGRIVTHFNKFKTEAKGIDIAGVEGASVVAASSGKVVYSGNGLISYGNLVIIKHSRSYLSAYAYNKKLLVQEGETVKAGQKIAEIGKIDLEKPVLHFEIRKNGKPVNPLHFLPRS
ncbi:MAG: LysM peptidoglycan-binding domain-containing protein [Gammaproteobacteria bacterium]|nr:LysM peptidoglycan-binding domain-containing protein [Gammaproteobacteria bacterium]